MVSCLPMCAFPEAYAYIANGQSNDAARARSLLGDPLAHGVLLSDLGGAMVILRCRALSLHGRLFEKE